MSYRLVYVIGPSGAGKDSVLQGLRDRWDLPASAHWARRSITRPADAGGEQHEALDSATFEVHRKAQDFAMYWSANGHSYGIRHTEIQPLEEGLWVFVNGSRQWLHQLLDRWPSATVVHIGATPEVLAQRLSARGRESSEEVSARLARQVPLALPESSICIQNDGALHEAVNALKRALLDRHAQAGRTGAAMA